MKLAFSCDRASQRQSSSHLPYVQDVELFSVTDFQRGAAATSSQKPQPGVPGLPGLQSGLESDFTQAQSLRGQESPRSRTGSQVTGGNPAYSHMSWLRKSLTFSDLWWMVTSVPLSVVGNLWQRDMGRGLGGRLAMGTVVWLRL